MLEVLIHIEYVLDKIDKIEDLNLNVFNIISDKSHLIMSCTEATNEMIYGLSIDSSKTEVLLGITIYHELKFDDHVNRLCKKV